MLGAVDDVYDAEQSLKACGKQRATVIIISR
jgi:hypothetical protein